MTNRERYEMFGLMKAGFPTEKHWRKFVKNCDKKDFGGRRREMRPLLKEMRIRLEDDGESWIEYGFFKGAGLTDDEVREHIDEEIRYRVYSLYDCTGQPVTHWVDWHRNPTGLISYINHCGLDL